MGLSNKRLEDIVTLSEAIKEHGWSGVALEHTGWEIARMVGLSHWEYTCAVRAIKENPDLGISVSTKRGSWPTTVFTVGDARIADEIVREVRLISESKAEENLKRMIRDASTSFVAWNKSDKSRTQSRRMKRYAWRMRSFLLDLHDLSVEDGDPFEIQEMSERALAQVGVRFDSNHDGTE